MAKCSFCGHPTDKDSAFHDTCRERHHKATLVIPSFFKRILGSQISAARFVDLLNEAAAASFVRAEQLEQLCIEGISSQVSDILENRLVTEAEELRIGEILKILNAELLQSPSLATLFIKNEILRNLSQGTVPDRIEVIGDMPLLLRKTESILWIFNQVQYTAYGKRPSPSEMPPPLKSDYYSTVAFATQNSQANREGRGGNLVLTNYNVFFISSPTEHRPFPIARIESLRAHVDAIEIGYPNNIFTFSVADPWFLANAIAFLSRRLRGTG